MAHPEPLLARICGLLGSVALGCASSLATNVPITRVDDIQRYDAAAVEQNRDIGDVALLIAFSGGGTRAAALAYGVMLELRDTPVRIQGEPRRLLDEIDVITSVSGGSFTAAYYGLHGDRLFEDFEERFLRRKVETGILLRLLLPYNWIRLLSPGFDRTSIATDYYDAEIFDGATYRDLLHARGPLIHINSTNISAETRFTFNQTYFDLICSDLGPVHVAKAVTASSAVPVVFPAVILENFAGRCDLEEPGWVAEALQARKANPRRYHIARELRSYTDRKQHPYLHLVDGGIADNLGVRAPLDAVVVGGGIWQRLAELGVRPPRHLAFIVVNAGTDPARPYRFSPRPPPVAELVGAISDTQIHRFNFETMALLESSMQAVSGSSARRGAQVQPHLIQLAAYEIEDPDERRFFNQVPTALQLDDATVDRLIALGRKLLRESPDYRALVEALR